MNDHLMNHENNNRENGCDNIKSSRHTSYGNIRRRILRAVLLLFCLVSIPVITISVTSMDAWCGDINDAEAGVLAVAKGTFEYEGKTYAAYSSYINKLYNYLSKDSVDLTAGQAKKVINYIYSNVKRGIDRGYVYEIKETPGTEQNTESRTERNSGTGTEENSSGEPGTESTEASSGTEQSTEPGTNGNQNGNQNENNTEISTDSTESTEKHTEQSTEKNSGAIDDPDHKGDDPDDPNKGSGDEDINLDEFFSDLGDNENNSKAISERVSPEDADASAVIKDNTIVIDVGDGDPIELESDKQIVPTSWTMVLIITAAVSFGGALIACFVLIFTHCMRFYKEERKKPLPGHRRRRKIRKICRRILMVTTAISITGIAVLIALFVALFNPGRIEQNIQDSGYFRYAYIEYLSERGHSLEGVEYLSDEEAAVIAEKKETEVDSEKAKETLLSYDEFMIREKQATQQLLNGNRDVVYQESNVAPYLLQIKEDIRFAMILSAGLFLGALVLGCVFTIFMDFRRNRGVRMIAISTLAGTVIAGFFTIFLLVWSPAKRLFIEPDYLYLFFRNYMDWIVKIFATISIFGIVLGMALVGIFMSRNRGRS